jgi:hypothetical protein
MTSAIKVDLLKKLLLLFPIIFQGILQIPTCLLSQFQYQPTLIYSGAPERFNNTVVILIVNFICNNAREPKLAWSKIHWKPSCS